MSKPHLVLLPGLNCTGELFAPQIAALADSTHIHIGNHQQDDSLHAMAQRILASAPQRFALAGLSMGGYIAFEILRQAPDRVERLLLMNTNARADNPEQAALRQSMIELALGGQFSRVCTMTFPMLVHSTRRDDANLKRAIDAMAQATGADIYARQQRTIMGRPDSRAFLPTIAVPTMILVGANDQITPPKVAEEMQRGIPGSGLEIIPECGHLSTLERPEAVTAIMRLWLSQ